MTEAWFRDLAERLRDAADYAAFDGQSSLARELTTAERAALELASGIANELARTVHPSRTGRGTRHYRPTDDGCGNVIPLRRPAP